MFNGKTLAIDTSAPTTTITAVEYTDSGDGLAGTLVLTGNNFTGTNGLGVTQGNDAKSYLNWDNFVWQVKDGSGVTSSVKFNPETEVTSAIVTNNTTMTITLDAAANTALKGTENFAAQGAADSVAITAGFIKDISGNVSTTDAATLAPDYADATRPTVTSFKSSSVNKSYIEGDKINITAETNEEVLEGSVVRVVLDTGDQLNLVASAKGYNLSADYTVTAGDNSGDLDISSIISSTVTDIYGNTMTSEVVPIGSNLSDNNDIVVDTLDLAILSTNWTDSDGDTKVSAEEQVTLSFFEAVGSIGGSNDIETALEAILGGGASNVIWASDGKSVTFDATDTLLDSYTGDFSDLAGNTETLTFTFEV